jgi:hypothetical protein
MPYLGNVPSSFNVGTNNIDNDAITTEKIAAGAVVNADVNAAAAIAGTKISPDFGSQNILTTGTSTAASFSPSSSSVPTNGFYLPSANNLAISTNGQGRLFVASDGKVGVGTASPATAVHISGSGTQRLRITGTGTANAILTLDAPSTFANYIEYGASASTPLVFYDVAAAAERARFDTSGRLGLGTSSPATTFDVNGDINLKTDGALTWGGTYATGSPTIAGTKSTGVITFYPTGSTSGEKMRLDSSGRLGIGTTSPSELLHLSSGHMLLSSGYDIKSPDNFAIFDTASSIDRFGFSTGNTYNTRSGGTHTFSINSSEVARIDSSGRLLVGTSTSNSTFDSAVQIAGTGANSTQLISRFVASSDGPRLYISKSRGSTVGTNTIVASGDELGSIEFRGANGSGYDAAASITALVDGTPGSSNDMPGRLVFSTTADGASSPTERMRIANNGAISTVVPGGSTLYPAYDCRAWVNFNGTGTVAIRGSGNVSSITDNGVDDYTVNFSNALVDANYATTISVNQEDSNTYSQHFGVVTVSNASYSLKSASQVRMRGRNTISSNYDPFDVSVAIFR